jgi:hypothetical protein
MSCQSKRAEWFEGNRRIIADVTSQGLELWERDAWEVRWYQATATAARIAKAKALLRIG